MILLSFNNISVCVKICKIFHFHVDVIAKTIDEILHWQSYWFSISFTSLKAIWLEFSTTLKLIRKTIKSSHCRYWMIILRKASIHNFFFIILFFSASFILIWINFSQHDIFFSLIKSRMMKDRERKFEEFDRFFVFFGKFERKFLPNKNFILFCDGQWKLKLKISIVKSVMCF